MRRLQSIRDVNRYLNRIINGQRTSTQSIIERFAFDELQNEVLLTVCFLKTVNRANVPMTQRREHLRLSLKPRQPIRITRQMLRQRFDRNLSIKPRVVRKIHYAHPAAAYFAKEFKGTKSRSAAQHHQRACFRTMLVSYEARFAPADEMSADEWNLSLGHAS